MCLCYLSSAKTAWKLVNWKADFFYKTNRFESIRITNRIDSNRELECSSHSSGWTSCERLGSTEDVICLYDITHTAIYWNSIITLIALLQWSRPDNQLRPSNTVLFSNSGDGQKPTGDDVCCLLTSKISANWGTALIALGIGTVSNDEWFTPLFPVRRLLGPMLPDVVRWGPIG